MKIILDFVVALIFTIIAASIVFSFSDKTTLLDMMRILYLCFGASMGVGAFYFLGNSNGWEELWQIALKVEKNGYRKGKILYILIFTFALVSLLAVWLKIYILVSLGVFGGVFCFLFLLFLESEIKRKKK